MGLLSAAERAAILVRAKVNLASEIVLATRLACRFILSYTLPDGSTALPRAIHLRVTERAILFQLINLGDVLKKEGIEDSGLQEDRNAILAIGSNGSPEQLARKFPVLQFPKGVVIPVVRAVLKDFDVVYAPVIASYGSCAATLAYSPGTRVELAVTFLTNSQLEHMHKTEGSYNLMQLNHIELTLAADLSSSGSGLWPMDEKFVLDTILLYNHQLGALKLFNNLSPTAFAIQEISAKGRKLPEKLQTEMLAAIQTSYQHNDSSAIKDSDNQGSTSSIGAVKLGSSQDVSDSLDNFILSNVLDKELRAKRNQFLAEMTALFDYPHATIVSRLSALHV